MGKLVGHGRSVAADGHRQPDGECPVTISARLLQWQAEGDTAAFESLVQSIQPLLEGLAGRTLRRHGIADTSAIDDAVSLVLDHLRRLHGTADGERHVARFLPVAPQASRVTPGDEHQDGHRDGQPVDGGMAYVRWLIRDRAADVARIRRRDTRHAIPFSRLSHPVDRLARGNSVRRNFPDEDAGGLAEQTASVHEAIASLDPRLREVIELLLDGKSQSSIALTLHVCEGTVSRMRRRAILELRRLLGS